MKQIHPQRKPQVAYQHCNKKVLMWRKARIFHMFIQHLVIKGQVRYVSEEGLPASWEKEISLSMAKNIGQINKINMVMKRHGTMEIPN